jgi:hypothetical protein
MKKIYKLLFVVLMLLFLLAENGFAANADNNLPAQIKDLRKDVRRELMARAKKFDIGPYQSAPFSLFEDSKMKDACFRSMSMQDKTVNRGSNDDLKNESTLGTDINTIIGSVSDKCMPMRSTAKFSPLDLNKWYLTSIIDPTNPQKYYRRSGDSGSLYRAESSEGGNRLKNASRLVRPDSTMLNGCSIELMVNNASGPTKIDDPIWMRRELDNCLNQYILQHGRFPRVTNVYTASLFAMNTGLCQPLRLMRPPTKYDLYEYAPSEYLGVAWRKLLVDHTYKKTNNANAEPNYEKHSKVKIIRKIEMPESNFGQILVEDLAEGPLYGMGPVPPGMVNLHYEKILDPSHPFSPRWDYKMQDRSLSFFPQLVRCAEVPVDIMTFRQGPFEASISKKIMFNIICSASFWCRKFNKNCSVVMGNQCCSTDYRFKDKVNGLFRRMCGLPIIDGCNFIARPLTPINTLKMREVNSTNFQGGEAPEGYNFKDYFGNHKPYMRCWDTNTECGSLLSVFPSPNGTLLYNPLGGSGANYAIVGAGREGESCMIGGGKGLGGIANPDPITSWSELKLYYVRSMRMNVKCIANHEKLFKYSTGEDGLLRALGQNIPIREQDSQGNYSTFSNVEMPFPWLGYLSDPKPAQRFPNFGNANVSVQNLGTGLDGALPNDVLVFGDDLVRNGVDPTIARNPYVGIVANADNVATRAVNGGSASPRLFDFVKIRAYNHGKYLDACGNTDMLGDSTVYTMFRNALPAIYSNMFSSVAGNNVPPSYHCLDPALSACIEPLWNNIPRYKIESAY